jgi:hypothetical protein
MPPAGSGGPFSRKPPLPQGAAFFLYGEFMSILNKRNAVVGWIVVKVSKRVVKKKAADVTPSAKTGGAAAGALAAVGGALLFWRKRSGTPDE